jgi:hypothetical protein
MPINSEFEKNSKKRPILESVAEQPGMFIFLIGMVISLFLGFLIRGLIAEPTIKAKVQEAIQATEFSNNIKVGRAWIRLSSGVFPDLSLVLSQVHFESENSCWGGPAADIQEIRFPLSIISLIAGESPIDHAEIDEMTLLLRKDPKDCNRAVAKPKNEGEANPINAATSSLPSGASKEKAEVVVKAKVPFRHINIDLLKVNYLPIPFSSFNFFNLEISLPSMAPLVVNLQTKLEINGETLSGEYSSHSSLQVQYDESLKKSARLEWTGSWREGRYEIKGDFERESKNYNLAMSLHHLPLSQIFPVLKKYKIMISEFNGKQTWISADAKSSGSWTEMAAAPWNISEVKLEGDIGEMKAEEIQFHSLQPIKFEPVRFELKNMNIDSVLVFLGKEHPSQALGKTGVFNGNLDFKNPNDITLSGEHGGLEFIFSNKGSRQYQEVSKMQLLFRLSDGQWTGKIFDFKIKDGNLSGRVDLQATKAWDDLNLSAKLQSFKLSPQVEDLITQGGSLGDIGGDIGFRFRKGNLKHLSGSVHGTLWVVEKISFQEPVLQFQEMGDGEFGVQFQLKKMESDLDWKLAGSPKQGAATEYLSLLGETGKEILGERLVLQDLTGKFLTHGLSDFYWSDLKGKSTNFSFSSKGGWSNQSLMSGELKIGTKKRTTKWNIRGTRDTPQLLKE